MLICITSQWTHDVLYTGDHGSIKEALELAVDRGMDLQGADLQGADLGGTDLWGADLVGAKGLQPATGPAEE